MISYCETCKEETPVIVSLLGKSSGAYCKRCMSKLDDSVYSEAVELETKELS